MNLQTRARKTQFANRVCRLWLCQRPTYWSTTVPTAPENELVAMENTEAVFAATICSAQSDSIEIVAVVRQLRLRQTK